jgi:hypothetical protein
MNEKMKKVNYEMKDKYQAILSIQPLLFSHSWSQYLEIMISQGLSIEAKEINRKEEK